MNIREQTEKIERETLSQFATLSENTLGRVVVEEKCPMRTDFQRDRDRITHSKSFRRLMHKTQVFLSPEGDHYRTRLTHTLEVAQISRAVARAMRLNEDLTEAVALGHDLGHTPFGHAGERALNDIMPEGFKHFEHSVRVVEYIEKSGKGLNLTYETKNGIACHTRGEEAVSVEGRIIRWTDRIAYINHDIEDAIAAGVIKSSDIPNYIKDVLGDTKTKRITTLINSLIENSVNGDLNMAQEVHKAYKMLHEFMFDKVYLNPYAKAEEKKVPHIIESLFNHFKKIDNLPDKMKKIAKTQGSEKAACYHIAGMTDRYAIYCYENLFIPKSWNIGL